jgi:hypothetical protein
VTSARRLEVVRTVCVAAVALIVVCGSAASELPPADFGVAVVGPVDALGVPTRRPVPARVPFLLRVELFTNSSSGPGSVSYDLDLPTAMTLATKPPHPPADGTITTCLRSCSVGWPDTTRARAVPDYYALVAPGPGQFIVEARIVSTNRHDTNPADDMGSATIDAKEARLTLGAAVPETAPIAGRAFVVTVSVRRLGEPVTPTSARCVASLRRRALRGAATIRSGRVRCAWTIPAGAGGALVRTTVRVALQPTSATRSRAFRIHASS